MNKDLKSELSEKISEVIEKLYGIKDFEALLQPTRDKKYGDLTTTVALQISKNVDQNPIKIAESIVSHLGELDNIEKVTVVAPGFLNFYLTEDNVKEILKRVDHDYGKLSIGDSKKIMVEYGQPNTHKMLTAGHLKSLVIGESVSRLFENAGYEVVRANYFGDIGMQTAKATWGAIQKGFSDEIVQKPLSERVKFLNDSYIFASAQYKDNENAKEEIKRINEIIYKGEKSKEYDVYKELRKWSIKHQNEIFKKFGVKYDREYPESEVFEDAIDYVKENCGEGKPLKYDDGAIIFEGEKHGLHNWVFLTVQGFPTYSGKDLALAHKKVEEYPDIDKYYIFTSVEQNSYFAAVIKVIEMINPDLKGNFIHKGFGWVLADGKKSSSRLGNSFTALDLIRETTEAVSEQIDKESDYTDGEIRDIIDKVSTGVIKFLILSHEFHKDFSFDLDSFTSFDGFTGAYVMYSYARINSIIDKAGFEIEKDIDLRDVLDTDIEIELIKKLGEFPLVLERAVNMISTHGVCRYLYDLAQLFNNFYGVCPVLGAESEDLMKARLLLLDRVGIVLRRGLDLLGIDLVERM
ncbi:MAG TPA: arginine--tRNA ligase [bacterium]|nr:arginine--tRNA ligase [bacterium]